VTTTLWNNIHSQV